ncbi:MAG TPA: transposon-transfer assisting family protein [Clostridia bacterium]|nr:transposon-transfer assisting family protein [Clostridia bacterium]
MTTLDSRNTIPAQQFSIDEMNLMCLFSRASIEELKQAILFALPWLEKTGLSVLARNTLYKLSQITEEQFNSIQFIPVYDIGYG